MSTPHICVTSRAGYFIPLIILYDSKNEDTTLPVPSFARLSPSPAPPSSPPPSLLPSSSRKRSILPSPPLSPVALVALALMDELSPERIESVEDDVETLRARLAYAEYENVALRVKVETLEQHNEVTRDLLKIAKGRITLLQLRAVAAEQQDMNIYNMKLEQFQVNTKFLNTLPLEWSKFVTGVKLVRDLHTTNIDQLHAYLGQHEFHANEKMAREAEFKKQRVFNTGNGVAKPVWTNANRVNHANQFVPRSVQLNAGRPNINSVRPNINTGRTNINSVRPNINTGRTNVNPVRPRVNTGSSNVNTVRSRQPVPTKTSNSFSPKRPQVNQFNQRRHFSKSHSSVRRPFAKNTAQMSHSHAVKGNWGSAVKTSAGYNWRNTIPNSNCNGGPISIRTVNAKGPQGRPKPEKAWIPDENQILLKVPRHHNIYSFDMKIPTTAKGFACLIAKATCDESKLWHMRPLLFRSKKSPLGLACDYIGYSPSLTDSDNETMMLVFIVMPNMLNNKTIQPQIITTVSNNNAKFPYLKKDEYEVWAMKMEYWITNNDMNIWKKGIKGKELPCFSQSYDQMWLDFHSMEMHRLSQNNTGYEDLNNRKMDLGGNGLEMQMGFNKNKVDDTSDFKEATLQECRAKGGNDKQRYSSFKIQEIGKKEEDSKALITVDTLVDWTEHDGQSDGVIAPKVFGMIAGCDTEDAIEEGAAKIYNLITIAIQRKPLLTQRVLQKNQLTLEDKIRVLSIELENTTNLLKHSERINAIAETAKKELQTKLDNHLVQIEKWRTSSKNLFRLIDSSMFAKADSYQSSGLPPLLGDYTPSIRSHWDLDESQMFLGTKSSTSGDSNSVSNDFVSCDNSDKSSEVNTNDFASSDSSVKSSEPKLNMQPPYASTSSVSKYRIEAEIESNVGTPIQEPIIVQDLPSFSCNSSDKNENTSRTSCNKNGYFNKKAGHFRKNASSVSKLCFVCGSSTHLIKDCDFYEKQMANKTVAVLLRTGKVNIPPARPQPVPTGKPKVPAPVPTGRQNRPFPVPTDRGYSPSENPYSDAEDEGIFDSGCSRSMIGNMERLDDFQEFQGGKVTFGGGKDTDCLMLSKDFKLPDDSMVLLRVPRKHNLYTINLNNLSPRTISEPLQLLHMDLLGPTSIRKHWTTNIKAYVITHDYSRFLLVLSIRTIMITYPILKDFINLVENQLNKKVKAIRCDNGTEFKNAHIIELCGSKGIKRDYSNARTPQQNGVAERKNRTLIEAARTMLADSKLPTMFWTEAVRTACYVLNRVLVTSPHNKTPYALLTGNIPSVSHFKPFGCHVTILNTSDHLGKFDGKADEGYIEKPMFKVLVMKEHKKLCLTLQSTQDADSDSECDEQVIIIPSYPSHSIQEPVPTDISSDEVDDTPLDSAEEIFQKELARLKVPTGSIQIPSGDTTISPGSVPVPTGCPTDSFFDNEPTTRFPSPSDLGNNEPSLGIFSSSSYDDEFGANLNNLASTVEVSPMVTKRINTIHPQSLIIGDHTSAVQTRSKVNKTTTGESAFTSRCIFLLSSMAALRYRDEHNKVGYLQKPKGSDDNHQILDFLGASHIRYALTHDPIIFDSLVKQFWSTATLRSSELGPPTILATIDKTPYTITEESVRSQLQLVDDGGIDDLPIVDIYSGMDNLGYVTEGKLTFFKNKFSPQWRFLVHTLLHCLSTKSGSWDQFGSSIAVALICLSDGRCFNWSSYIFKGMLGIETSITRQYHVFKLSSKLFANMKLNFVGQTLPLLDVMLTQAQEGEGAGADAQAVPPPLPETILETRHESDYSQDHVSTPTRPQATPHVAPVFKHDQQTEPNIASSSRIHETEDDSLGGSFHVSPPRFTQSSPTRTILPYLLCPLQSLLL
ncbi:putative ribonuclease H-like domain-containing protein [Tanacetum coccineum]